MATPALVYLDTQDYSLLADAQVGRGEPTYGPILDELLELKATGLARFAYSLPVVSELLQYRAEHRELTLRKAGMIELLCAGNAFSYFPGLLAHELVTVGLKTGHLDSAVRVPPALTHDNGWSPPMGASLGGFRERGKRAVADELAKHKFVNRKVRRTVEARARVIKFGELAAAGAEEFLAKWPLSREFVLKTLAGVLDGKVSVAYADRALRAEFCEPTRLIHLYFERYEGERDLPFWMRDLGVSVQNSILQMREAVEPVRHLPEASSRIRQIISELVPASIRRFFGTADDELRDAGLDAELTQRLLEDDEVVQGLPSYRLFSRLLPDYVEDNAGVREQGRSPHRSDGGDMMHAVYAMHCDLWRGDAYFSEFVRRAVPPGSGRVVSRLAELPGEIRSFHNRS